MKIALVLHAMDLGGAQRVASTLSVELAKEHDVTFITFEDSERIYPQGGKTLCLNFDFYKSGGAIGKVLNIFRLSWVLRKVFKEQKFDKIFTYMEGANYPAILADKNVIGSMHCNPEMLYTTREWIFSRLVYPRAKTMIVVSDDVATIVKKKLKLKNVVRVYNPVDFAQLEKAAKDPIDFKEEYIVAIGRLTHQKNFELLIESFALTKTKETSHLLILGEGELREKLEGLIRDYKMESHITLVGFDENPFKYVAKARFLASSSHHEAFPMSLIESLSLGIPVVSTDCPTGPREIVTHEENGLLTPVSDAKALAKAIDRLYFDTDLYDHLKANAKPSVEFISVEKITEQMLSV